MSSPPSNVMGPSDKCVSGFHRTSPWLPSSASLTSMSTEWMERFADGLFSLDVASSNRLRLLQWALYGLVQLLDEEGAYGGRWIEKSTQEISETPPQKGVTNNEQVLRKHLGALKPSTSSLSARGTSLNMLRQVIEQPLLSSTSACYSHDRGQGRASQAWRETWPCRGGKPTAADSAILGRRLAGKPVTESNLSLRGPAQRAAVRRGLIIVGRGRGGHAELGDLRGPLAAARQAPSGAVGTVKQMLQNGHEAGRGHRQFW
jgi:hypothetical protein